jgi:hypothetical protein
MVIQKKRMFYKPPPESRIRIRIISGRWIRIRIRVKSRIRLKGHNSEALEPWRAGDARNGGLEAIN